MPTGTVILLGAIAGATIFIGLPVARIPNISVNVRAFLSMLATGVLLFLLVDVTKNMVGPVEDAFAGAKLHQASSSYLGATILLMMMLLGLGVGLVGIIYLTRNVGRYFKSTSATTNGGTPAIATNNVALVGTSRNALTATKAQPTIVNAPVAAVAATASSVRPELAPQTLSVVIATGIGVHNLAEGLAIGQSASSGAIQLAILLIIGFALHNMTEGFGIAGPLTGKPVSWRFLGMLGLIGGGPTFVGTVLGINFHSNVFFVFCLAFAAGAIIYVIMELLGMARRFATETVVAGLLSGFVLGLLTDMILHAAGA